MAIAETAVKATSENTDESKTWTLTGKKKEDFLEEARRRRDIGEEADADMRVEAVANLKFILGGQYQWPKLTWDMRTNVGLPCLTINDGTKYTNQIIGDQLKNRPQIKVKPEDAEADPKMCQFLEDHIRQIEHSSQFEAISDENYKHMGLSGYPTHCWVKAQWKIGKTFAQEIRLLPIQNQFSFVGDPNFEMPDGRDRKWGFILKTMSHKEYETQFPGKDIPENVSSVGTGMQHTKWYESDTVTVADYILLRPEKKKRIALLSTGEVMDYDDAVAFVESETAEGRFPTIARDREMERYSVWHSILAAHDILEGPKRLSSRDGMFPIVSLFPPSLMVDGKRYNRSMIQDYKDPARLYNYMWSVQAERIVPKPDYMVTKEMINGHEAHWQKGQTERLPYLIVNATPMGWPKESNPTQISTAEVDMRRQALDDKKATIGVYDQNTGNAPSETSGVAIRARDQQKDTGTAEYFNCLKRFKKLVGDVILDMLPEVHDTEDSLPTLGFDGQEGRWSVNKMSKDANGTDVMENDLSTGRYGAIITTGPTFATQKEEATSTMIEFGKLFQGTPILPAIAPLMAKNLDIIYSDKLVEILKALQPEELRGLYEDAQEEQPQIPPEVKQAVEQIQKAAQEQMQQAQQAIAQLQQELQDAKAGIPTKMAEIEANKAISAQEMQLEKDKIMQGITLKEKEIEQKERDSQRDYDLGMERIKAEFAFKMKALIEEKKMQKEQAATAKTANDVSKKEDANV